MKRPEAYSSVTATQRHAAGQTALAEGPSSSAVPPGTLEPCDGSGTHGWVEPVVLLTTSPRRAVWSCPNCPLMWRLGGDR
jgi:hypothetical protein